MKHELKYAPSCDHQCSGNCRRIGCNCECGEFHGYYEPEETEKKHGDFSPEQQAYIEKAERTCPYCTEELPPQNSPAYDRHYKAECTD